MSILQDLYREVILDHNRSPRNFRPMDNPTRTVEGYNPLCGDHFTIHVRIEEEKLTDISFEGHGCAISKASASIMSSTLKGKSREEAERTFEEFHRLVTGAISDEHEIERLGKLAAFAGVSEFPARVKCAILPWHALHEAIVEGGASVTTE